MIMCESAITPLNFTSLGEKNALCVSHANNLRTKNRRALKMNPRSASSPNWNAVLLPKSSAEFGVYCATGVNIYGIKQTPNTQVLVSGGLKAWT